MCLALCYLSGKEQFCAVQILLLLLLLYSLSSVSVVRARACMCGCRLHLSLSEYMRACTMTVRPTITDNATNQPTVNWETERETQRQTDRGRGGVWGGRCRHILVNHKRRRRVNSEHYNILYDELQNEETIIMEHNVYDGYTHPHLIYIWLNDGTCIWEGVPSSYGCNDQAGKTDKPNTHVPGLTRVDFVYYSNHNTNTTLRLLISYSAFRFEKWRDNPPSSPVINNHVRFCPNK